MKRSALTIVTVVVLCCAILVGGTLAYLNAYEKKDNLFVYMTDPSGGDKGKFNIEIEEKQWDAVGKDQAQDFTPGRKIEKDPVVVSTGKEPAYVGIKLTTSKPATHPDGTTTPILLEYKDFVKSFTLNLDTTKWKYVGKSADENEAYYVYIGDSTDNGILKKDAKTSPLFDYMTVADNIDQILKPEHAWNLEVHAFAAQSEKPDGFTGTWDAEAALMAEFGPSGVNSSKGAWDPK